MYDACMFRRFFQWLTLALLALCIVTWAGSYWRCPYVGYNSKTRSTAVRIECGRLGFDVIEENNYRNDWYAVVLQAEDWSYWDQHMVNFKFLGFTFKHDVFLGFTVPLWFPTALSAALVFFLWRKRRHKPTGFPLEATETPPRHANRSG
jgi:hypothetical protein